MNEKSKFEESLRAEFAAMSADEKAEFGSVEAYVAFKQADAEGRVRNLSRGMQSSVPAGSVGPGLAGDEETLEKEFAAMSSDEQAEFGDVEAYVSFKQAEAAGRAKICGGSVATFSSAPKKRVPDKKSPTREELIRADEKRQVACGKACGSDGMPL